MNSKSFVPRSKCMGSQDLPPDLKKSNVIFKILNHCKVIRSVVILIRRRFFSPATEDLDQMFFRPSEPMAESC